MNKKPKSEEKTSKLEKMALEILEASRDIYSISDLVNEMGIARSTFYFQRLDKSDIIKKALLKNKQFLKRKMRYDWFKSKNPTLQLALYKLLADDDELARLNNKENNNTDSDNGILEKLLNRNDIKLVVDPTYLLSSEDWRKFGESVIMMIWKQ